MRNELLPFLVAWAARYSDDSKLDGLHPVHYDLMLKHGARMDGFKRATNSGFVDPSAETK